MNELLYEKLERARLLEFGVVNRSRIASTSVVDLNDLAKELVEITSAEHLGREQSIFAHSASLSLGGGREYCSQLKCRMSRMYELAQFALLYADRVYIRNFLADHIPHPGGMKWPDEIEFRQAFGDDLTILNEIRPLVEKGIIIPFTPPLNYCPHCLAKHSLGSDADNRLSTVEQYLLQRFFEEISIKLRKHGEFYGLTIEGPESLIDHGHRGFDFWSLPEFLRSMPRIMSKVDAGEPVPLSRTVRKKLGYHYHLTGEVLQNIAFELTSSQSLNTSFLTERPLHIDVLNMLSENPAMEQRNSIAQEHLTSFVPFVDGVSLTDLLKLREREGEEFVLYRRALNKAIDEYKGQGDDFTERDAQTLYADVIAPKLAVLDSKVKSARKGLIKDTARDVLAWVGAISFGIYAGFVPTDLVTAAKVLGLTKVIAELLELAMRRADISEDIRNEEMYFLWRVRQARKS